MSIPVLHSLIQSLDDFIQGFKPISFERQRFQLFPPGFNFARQSHEAPRALQGSDRARPLNEPVSAVFRCTMPPMKWGTKTSANSHGSHHTKNGYPHTYPLDTAPILWYN